MQLFCFPFAGGNASFYNNLSECLEPDIKVTALEYAGHGNRHQELFCRNLEELKEDLCNQICREYIAGEDISLMGYSMGAISIMILYNQLLEIKEIPKPKHIFLAAHEPFTRKEFLDFIKPEAEDLVKKRVAEFGGVPDRLLSKDVFWRTYLPIYKSDFYLIGLFDFEKENPRIDVPATLFFSESDTPRAQMEKWGQYLIAGYELIEYDGNHFFINEHYTKMAKIIKQRLMT